jgi:glycosyltransferase involved in cell wall biosynthesis
LRRLPAPDVTGMTHKKSRILHYIHCAEAGGEAHHVIMLAKTINRDLFSLDIACPDNALFEYMAAYGLEACGTRVYRIRFGNHFDVRGIWRLFRLIVRNGYDLVHIHQVTSGVIGRIAARLALRKIVVTESGLAADHYWIKNKVKLFLHTSVMHPLWNAFFVDGLIAISGAVQESVIRREHISPKKVFCIPYGTDFFPSLSPERKAVARANLSLPQNSIIVGSAGRLTRQKGYENLLQALPGLIARCPNLLCIIAGDGESMSALREKTAALNISGHVRFLGWQKNISPVLDALDIFVLPSLWEPFGLVLVEAMAHGKPVVATAVNAIPEIVENGRTGILVEPGNTQALADALAVLAQDPQRAVAMGMSGRMRAEARFSRTQTTGKIESLYRTLLRIPASA